MVGGAMVMLLGSIGVLRMPDLFTRMQTATKPGILGTGLIGLAVAIYFWNPWVTLRAVLISTFFFLTAPVAAHAIGRAAYMSGVRLWDQSVRDDLAGQNPPTGNSRDSD
jgi:multicomponent Na+:H+ antiporter subunit G